jgi:hypothetical protein
MRSTSAAISGFARKAGSMQIQAVFSLPEGLEHLRVGGPHGVERIVKRNMLFPQNLLQPPGLIPVDHRDQQLGRSAVRKLVVDH